MLVIRVGRIIEETAGGPVHFWIAVLVGELLLPHGKMLRVTLYALCCNDRLLALAATSTLTGSARSGVACPRETTVWPRQGNCPKSLNKVLMLSGVVPAVHVGVERFE